MKINIEYRTGDATIPQGKGDKIIVHICNDIGAWGRGFTRALSTRWKEPEEAYRKWFKNRDTNDFGLGALQMTRVEPDTWVANIIGQHGIQRRSSLGDGWFQIKNESWWRRDPEELVRYLAVRKGLNSLCKMLYLNEWNTCASVHMPRIGCGLAGGSWDSISTIIEEELSNLGVKVVVYDQPST